MKEYSLKASMVLIELHSSKDDSLDKMLKFSPSAKLLYIRLLARSVDTIKEQRWILRPKHGISRAKSIEQWLSNEDGASSMMSKDLLRYYRPSTYRDSLSILIDSGLVIIDDFNRMFLRYPIRKKLLSLEYAIKAIKASYRKDSNEENEDSNEDSNEATNTKKDFWKEGDKWETYWIFTTSM